MTAFPARLHPPRPKRPQFGEGTWINSEAKALEDLRGPRPTGLRYCMNSIALKLKKNNEQN